MLKKAAKLLSLAARVDSIHPAAKLIADREGFDPAKFTLPAESINGDALRVIKQIESEEAHDIAEGDVDRALETLDAACSAFDSHMEALIRESLSVATAGSIPNITTPVPELNAPAPRHSGGSSLGPPLSSRAQADLADHAEFNAQLSTRDEFGPKSSNHSNDAKFATLFEKVEQLSALFHDRLGAKGPPLSPTRSNRSTALSPTTVHQPTTVFSVSNPRATPDTQAPPAARRQYQLDDGEAVQEVMLGDMTDGLGETEGIAGVTHVFTRGGALLRNLRDIVLAVSSREATIEAAATLLCNSLRTLVVEHNDPLSHSPGATSCQEEYIDVAYHRVTGLLTCILEGVLDVDFSEAPIKAILDNTGSLIRSANLDAADLRSYGDPTSMAARQQKFAADELKALLAASGARLIADFNAGKISAFELAQLLEESKASIIAEHAREQASLNTARPAGKATATIPTVAAAPPPPPVRRVASPESPASSYVLDIAPEPASELSGKGKRNDISSVPSDQLVDLVRQIVPTIVNPATSKAKIKVLLDLTEDVTTAGCRLRSSKLLALTLPISVSLASGNIGVPLNLAKAQSTQVAFTTDLLAQIYGILDGEAPLLDVDDDASSVSSGANSSDGSSSGSATSNIAKLSRMYLDSVPTLEIRNEALRSGEREILDGLFSGDIDDANSIHIAIDGSVHGDLLRLHVANIRFMKACVLVFAEQSKDLSLSGPVRDIVYHAYLECKKYFDDPISVDAHGIQTSARFPPPANAPPNPYLNILVRVSHLKDLQIFAAANIIQRFLVHRTDILDLDVKWPQTIFPHKLMHAVIGPNQSPLEFLTFFEIGRDELTKAHIPLSLEALDWTVAAGQSHPILTDKFIVAIVALNIWSELAVNRGMLAVRNAGYMDRATYKRAKAGQLPLAELRAIVTQMSKDGVGTTPYRPKQEKPPPPPPPKPGDQPATPPRAPAHVALAAPAPVAPTAAAAPIAPSVGSGAFAFIGAPSPPQPKKERDEKRAFEVSVFQNYQRLATDWLRDPKQTLLTFCRAINTIGKKHGLTLLEGLTDKAKKFSPASLKLTQGDWTTLVHPTASTDPLFVAFFHLISDLAGGTKTLSAVGQAFARTNTHSKWKIRIAVDAKRGDDHLWLK